MQNLITLSFTADQISAIDQTLAPLEQQLAGLITLSPSDKQRMPKLGDKYDTFCRHTLEALADNPQLLPPTLDVARLHHRRRATRHRRTLRHIPRSPASGARPHNGPPPRQRVHTLLKQA